MSDERLALFSPGWFARMGEAAGGVAFPAVDLAVEYRAVQGTRGVVHHQTFREGRLVAWGPGAHPGTADVVLGQVLAAHVALLTRTGLGDRVLRATAVLDPASGRRLPPPPLDEVMVDWGGALPEVPTAEPFVVQQVLTDSPFGTVATWHRIERGRVVGSGLGRPEGTPDVTVQRRYALALAERTGGLDVLESLRSGGIDGDVATLMLLLGLYDSEECIEARRRLTTPAVRGIALLGDLLSSPGWATMAAAVRESAVAAGAMVAVAPAPEAAGDPGAAARSPGAAGGPDGPAVGEGS
ncbi:MAG TPA: hypothetical protein VKA65_15210 [Acidimicrobiales bacterium]|nr:hypothetical protein [Acidimicrobiales bacterium]